MRVDQSRSEQLASAIEDRICLGGQIPADGGNRATCQQHVDRTFLRIIGVQYL